MYLPILPKQLLLLILIFELGGLLCQVCDANPFYADELPSEDHEVYPPEVFHKEEINYYVEKFCKTKGRPYARIQKNIIVDCMSANTLWKIDYADNWRQAFTDALTYQIYDDYRGDDEEAAPKPGVVLVQEDSDDYKNMLELKEIIKFYNLPVQVDVIENYASKPSTQPISKIPRFLKNVQIQLDGL